jgi:hypothetical protein
VRWWLKGQPSIDFVRAKLHGPRAEAGALVDHLTGLQDERLQVAVEVFPFGTPRPEMAEVDVTIGRNLPGNG